MSENIIGSEIELEYTDLGVEVTEEFGGEPIPDSLPMWAPISYEPIHNEIGYINNWTYIHEITEEDVLGYIRNVLQKEPNEELINTLDYDDVYDYLLEKCRKDAEDDAEMNWEANLDYDEIDWQDPPDLDYEDLYD